VIVDSHGVNVVNPGDALSLSYSSPTVLNVGASGVPSTLTLGAGSSFWSGTGAIQLRQGSDLIVDGGNFTFNGGSDVSVIAQFGTGSTINKIRVEGGGNFVHDSTRTITLSPSGFPQIQFVVGDGISASKLSFLQNGGRLNLSTAATSLTVNSGSSVEVNLPSSADTATIDGAGAFNMTSGAISALQGKLNLAATGASTITGSTISVSSPGEVEIGLTNGTLDGVTASGPGKLTLKSFVVGAGGVATNMTGTGTSLTGGTINLRDGDWVNTGALNFTVASTVNLQDSEPASANRLKVQGGAASVLSTFTHDSTSPFNVSNTTLQIGGSLAADGDGLLVFTKGSGGNQVQLQTATSVLSITANGVLEVNHTTPATSTISGSGSLNVDGGQIKATAGTLKIDTSKATVSGATVTVATGSEVIISTDPTMSTWTDVSASGLGKLTIEGISVGTSVNPYSLTTAMTGDGAFLTGTAGLTGNWSNTGELTFSAAVNSSLTGAGGLVVDGGGSLVHASDKQLRIDDTGGLIQIGGMGAGSFEFQQNGGSVLVDPGAAFTVTADGSLDVSLPLSTDTVSITGAGGLNITGSASRDNLTITQGKLTVGAGGMTGAIHGLDIPLNSNSGLTINTGSGTGNLTWSDISISGTGPLSINQMRVGSGGLATSASQTSLSAGATMRLDGNWVNTGNVTTNGTTTFSGTGGVRIVDGGSIAHDTNAVMTLNNTTSLEVGGTGAGSFVFKEAVGSISLSSGTSFTLKSNGTLTADTAGGSASLANAVTLTGVAGSSITIEPGASLEVLNRQMLRISTTGSLTGIGPALSVNVKVIDGALRLDQAPAGGFTSINPGITLDVRGSRAGGSNPSAFITSNGTIDLVDDKLATVNGTLLVSSASTGAYSFAPAAGALAISSTGTLGGDGGSVLGTVTVASGGTIAPGLPGAANDGLPNKLTASTANFSSGSNFGVTIAGTGGADHSQLVTTTGLSLTATNLAASLGTGYTHPTAGTQLVIIDNQSGGVAQASGSLTGAGSLAEGSQINVAGGGTAAPFRVSYVGGTGNDVVLTALEKATIAATATPQYSKVIGGIGGLSTMNVDLTIQNTLPGNPLDAELQYTATAGTSVTGGPATGSVVPNSSGTANGVFTLNINPLVFGMQSGSVSVGDLAAANGPVSAGVTVEVVDHSNGSFNSAAVDNNTLNLNLGTVIVGAPAQVQNFDVYNFDDTTPRADLRLLAIDVSSSGDAAQLTTTLTSGFGNTAAGGSQAFNATMTTATIGHLSATYTAGVQDEVLPGGTANATPLTLNLTGSVLDHASGSAAVTSGDSFTAIVGANLNATVSVSNASGTRSDLEIAATPTINTGTISDPGQVAVAPGDSEDYTASFNVGMTPGPFSNAASFSAGDDQGLPGASPLGPLGATISGTVLDHSDGQFAGVGGDGTPTLANSNNDLDIDFGKVITGAATQTATFDVENLPAVYRADLRLLAGDVSSSGDVGSLTTSLSAGFGDTAAGGAQAASASMSSAAPGILSATYTLGVRDEALPGGTANTTPLTLTLSGMVVDHSNAAFNSTASDDNTLNLDLGTVIVGAPTQTSNFSVGNLTGLRADLRLLAGDVTPSGPHTAQLTTTLSSGFGNTAAGGTQALSASMTTGTIGSLSASYTAGVQDEVLPGGTYNATALTLNLTGNVLDHSDGALASPGGAGTATLSNVNNNLAVNFGTVITGAPLQTATFDVSNAAGPSRAGLQLQTSRVTASGDTGVLTTTLDDVGFSNLAAGGTQGYTASLSTGTLGGYAASYVAIVEDQSLPGATDNGVPLTLDLTGTVIGHAAGSAMVTSGTPFLAIVGAPGVTASVSLSNAAGMLSDLQVTAATIGTGTITGPTGIFIPPGGSQSYSANFVAVGPPGPYSTNVVFTAGDDQSLPGANPLGPIAASIDGFLIDHAAPNFANLASTALGTTLTMGFGDVLGGTATLPFALTNLASPYGVPLTAGMDLVSISPSGPQNGFEILGPTAFDNVVPGSLVLYTVRFTHPGTRASRFSATYVFALRDDDDIFGGIAHFLTLHLSASPVPEPQSILCWLVMLAAGAWYGLRFSRRRLAGR